MNSLETIDIENIIYEINGKQVMLDSDIAKLYKCKSGTKEVNQAVKNNPDKFPERFSWILNDIESSDFLVKNFDQKVETRGGKYKNPRVFTEQGVYMLATILKTDIATSVSIRIMDAFVKMRHYINYNMSFLPHRVLLLENKVDDNAKRIDELFDKFNPNDITDDCVYFNGEYYDAYSKVLDIFRKAQKELIIIDNYADKELLDITRTLNIQIILITKKDGLLAKKDIETYNKQYSNLKIIFDNTFHDRYFILDNKILYYCGASLNRIGYKTFSIHLVNDTKISNLLITEIMKKVEN